VARRLRPDRSDRAALRQDLLPLFSGSARMCVGRVGYLRQELRVFEAEAIASGRDNRRRQADPPFFTIPGERCGPPRPWRLAADFELVRLRVELKPPGWPNPTTWQRTHSGSASALCFDVLSVRGW
jgi:hypothetical protein